MHNFKLNLNGNDASDLKEQFMELHRLAKNLREHMDRMDHTHSRNYQTSHSPMQDRKTDLAEHREKQVAVDDLIEYAIAGAARVIKQRENL